MRRRGLGGERGPGCLTAVPACTGSLVRPMDERELSFFQIVEDLRPWADQVERRATRSGLRHQTLVPIVGAILLVVFWSALLNVWVDIPWTLRPRS